MRFTPKTEQEIQQALLLPDGEYDFEVISALDKQSKSGNDMIELKLRVFHEQSERFITDYLMEAMAFKLRHFCGAAGLMDEYESGALAAGMCVGKAGRVKLIIQKDKTGAYPDKNSVRDYVTEDLVSKPKGSAARASNGANHYGGITDVMMFRNGWASSRIKVFTPPCEVEETNSSQGLFRAAGSIEICGPIEACRSSEGGIRCFPLIEKYRFSRHNSGECARELGRCFLH
jgi:hypothetical protein